MEQQKPRHPVDPVVYLYLNTVTEMVYVGASLYGLEHRRRAHAKAAASAKSKSRFYRTLLTWPDEFWELTVLERCDTVEQLDAVGDAVDSVLQRPRRERRLQHL